MKRRKAELQSVEDRQAVGQLSLEECISVGMEASVGRI